MKDFEIIQNLVGGKITEVDLIFVDCYVRPQIGIFIPTTGPCWYASKENHTHLSYMIVIFFEENGSRRTHYHAEITSPDIPHNDATGLQYYCTLIEKNYFEKRYTMYADSFPIFEEQSFELAVTY